MGNGYTGIFLSNIDWGTCTAKWVLFWSVLWCLLVPLLVGWFILLPTGVGWNIMGYKSNTLPSYLSLIQLVHNFMLNYSDSPSTPQVHLPRPGTTISPSISSPASAPPWRQVHKWGGRPPFCTMVACHLLMYSFYGVYSCGFHCHRHRGVFPLPARPMCRRHSCNLPGCPVMEPLHDL